MEYFVLKGIHQTAVVLSICGFFVRGLASFRDAAWVRSWPAKTFPHVIDSLLLLSALMLVGLMRIHIGSSPWLMAKILGLLVYIGLGVVALRPRFTLSARIGAWLAALVVFGWIASVAISKTPWGFLQFT